MTVDGFGIDSEEVEKLKAIQTAPIEDITAKSVASKSSRGRSVSRKSRVSSKRASSAKKA